VAELKSALDGSDEEKLAEAITEVELALVSVPARTWRRAACPP